MSTPAKPLIVAAATAMLLLAGCVGTQGDAELEPNAAQSDLTVSVRADNVGDASHLGFELDRLAAHDANVSMPDGFHEVPVATGHADLVHDGEAAEVELASGSVPAGEYDQILIRLDNATLETGGDGGHDHGDDSDDHDHGDSGASSLSTGSLDIPLNASFEVLPEDATHITFVLDVEESLEGDSFAPVFSSAEITRGNQTVDTQTNLDTRVKPSQSLPSEPPATRIAVYAPNGDQVYEPPFDPEDGTFVNSPSAAFSPGATLSFSATPSEPVAKGAALESYEWSFGDGSTTSGQTASHAYDQQGVFEVELEVTDSYGNVGTHMVRVVVLQTEWTTTLVETSFEEGPGDWTTSSAGSAPVEDLETTWALDGTGYNSSTGWHVGHHLVHLRDLGAPSDVTNTVPGYSSNAEATLTSPTFTIPDEWTNAGYSFHIAGASEAGYDPLEISYSVEGGEGGTIASVDATSGWTQFEDLKALTDAAGKEVTFQFTFTSDDNTEMGPGFYVDEFVIGGVDIPMQNAHLLEDGGGHDGHDHEH